MNFKHLIIALLITFSSVAANAACTKPNLVGTWSVYVGSTNAQVGGYGYGKLTFNTTGTFNASPAASFLELKNGSKITFKSGDIKIASTCILSGNLTTTDDITFSVTQGRLNSSKNVVIGVYGRTDGDHGMFNLIR